MSVTSTAPASRSESKVLSSSPPNPAPRITTWRFIHSACSGDPDRQYPGATNLTPRRVGQRLIGGKPPSSQRARFRELGSDPASAATPISFLELRRRSGASPASGVAMELCVKSHGKWEVVDDDEVVLLPDKVIRCRFDLNHEVFPSGFMTSAGSAPTTEGSSLKSPASGSSCGITPSAAGQGLYRGAIQDWLLKRCPS